MAIVNTNISPLLKEGSNVQLTQDGQVITINVPSVSQGSRFNGYAYAVWSGTGLVFDVVWPSYYIDNVLYSAGSGQVTLNSADPTNPRLDVIAVDSTGVIKITGTADPNPVKPTVNVMTQLEITTVLVNATATTPAITDTTVYKENVEWTGASNNGTVTFNNTVTPFEGTYCVNSGSFNNTHYIRFTGASSYNVGDFGVLKFYLRLSASFASTTYINVRLFNTATAISSTVAITNGSYNFNRTATGYQLIIIPISAFTFTASVFNRVEFTFVGSNTSGFKMDNIILQSGSGTSPTGVLTGAGDQNYVTKWTGVTSLGNSLLYDNASGVGIGTITPATTSLLDLTSTTKGLLIPRMTGTQRDAIVSPATGLQVYNTTTNKINYYNGTAWTESGGGTPGGSDTQVQFNDGGAFGGDTGLTYNKTTDVLTSGGAILSGETASTIASFDGSKQIKSLATTTYPSLTELSYVKGVTSAIQTQLDGKQATLTNPVTGTGTTGQVAYWSGTNSITSESNLFWDATNDRLGIGTNTPTDSRLHLKYNSVTTRALRFEDSNVTYDIITSGGSSNGSFGIYNNTNGAYSVFIKSDGNVAIGGTTTTEKLRVSGNTRIDGTLENNGYVIIRPQDAFFVQTAASLASYCAFGYNSTLNAMMLQSVGTVHNTTKIITRNFQTGNGTVLFSTGSYYIGASAESASDAGYKLDVNGTARIQDNLTISDAKNVILGTTTGTKIGTATTQKIGFFNATPVVQPSAVTTAQGIADALSSLGLLASSSITTTPDVGGKLYLFNSY